MELEQIKAIVAMMKENELCEFSMESEGLKLRIKRGPEGVQPTISVTAAAPAPVAAPAAPAPAEAPAGPAPAPTDIKYITSPMVGTFYRSAAPDAPAYAEAGKNVEDETVVCIIEAMKVMNEIKAEIKGVIVECLVENAKPVEFGQKLFAVRVK